MGDPGPIPTASFATASGDHCLSLPASLLALEPPRFLPACFGVVNEGVAIGHVLALMMDVSGVLASASLPMLLELSSMGFACCLGGGRVRGNVSEGSAVAICAPFSPPMGVLPSDSEMARSRASVLAATACSSVMKSIVFGERT